MNRKSVIVFVCEHGSAKSVIAAAYFNKLAGELNLDLRAVARGTHPDPELSPKAIEGLRKDGLNPSEPTPQKLSFADMESSQRLVTFCELPKGYEQKIAVEYWDEVPAVGENYEKARDVIIARLNYLLNNV
jgi:arsenate reductase